MPSSSHTPLGHALRYTDECYSGMRDDHARTNAYYAAIDKTTKTEDIVLDIGTGALALLAIKAAQAGAKHVYAIEVNDHVAEAARNSIEAAGLTDRITVLLGFSTEISSIPQKATLTVHELIGEVAGEEGAFHAIADARRRFLAPGARSIPAQSRSLVAPCEYPDDDYCASLPDGLLGGAAGQAHALRLPGLPRRCLLAPAQTFEVLDFEAAAPEALQRSQLLFVAERSGKLCGLAVHVDLTMLAHGALAEPEAEGQIIDVSSAWEGSHWRNVLLLFERQVSIEAGQRVRVHATCDIGGPQPRYTLEASVEVASPDEGGGATWQTLGPALSLPEAALNCNDMMDLELERFSSL